MAKATTAVIKWLLEGDPWVEYRARRDLLGQPEDEPQVALSRRQMLATAQVRGLIAELTGWPGTVISSHKSAGQPFHKLTFVADLGLKVLSRFPWLREDARLLDMLGILRGRADEQGRFTAESVWTA